MSNEKYIGYRPNLEYKDEYISEASDIFNSEENIVNDNNNESIVEDIIEQTEIIDSLINKLPGNTSDIVSEVFDPVIDFIKEELEGNTYDKVPEEWEWKYNIDETPEDIVDDKDKEFSEDNFWEDTDPFPIIKEEHTKQEIIEKEYIKNLIDLFNDYLTGMHNALSNFWTSLVPAVLNKQSNEISMLVNNILLNSSDIKSESIHLLDSAIRNQITRSMKIDYFSNIYNAEETITHLKQFKAMYELRLRYANIKEKETVTKTDQMNNNILKGMQITYDKKYDVAYDNLFRYLKSSVDILNDTLQTWIIEIKSKQTLIEGKGIK